jgi:hypothetical protein
LLLLLVLLVLDLLLLLLLHVRLQQWWPLQCQHIVAAEVAATAAAAVGVGWWQIHCCALCCCVVHLVARCNATWCTLCLVLAQLCEQQIVSSNTNTAETMRCWPQILSHVWRSMHAAAMLIAAVQHHVVSDLTASAAQALL